MSEPYPNPLALTRVSEPYLTLTLPKVAAKRIGVNPLRLALERAREAEQGTELPLSEPVTPPPPVVTKPREAKPRSLPAPPTPLTGGDNYGTPPSPLTPAGPRVAVGAGGDNHGTGGAALAMQLRRAYGEAEAALEEWQLEEFTSSVQTYKECGEEAIQPIIQQLNAAARHHDVEMRDRGLKILQA